MHPEINDIISKYYQDENSPGEASYYVTPQYRNLVARRISAEEEDIHWRNFKNEILTRWPESQFIDSTSLGTESCFRLHLLTQGEKISSDIKEMLSETTEHIRELIVFVSILGPFYYYELQTVRKDVSMLGFTIEEVSPSDFSPWEKDVSGMTDRFWNSRGFFHLTEDERDQWVKGRYGRDCWDTCTISDLLFFG